MKTKIKNSGTKEFPFYQVMIDGEEYCATDNIENAKEIIKFLESEQSPSDGEVKTGYQCLSDSLLLGFDREFESAEDLEKFNLQPVIFPKEAVNAMIKFASQFKFRMPTDVEVMEWYSRENIINATSSSAIFKFRLWISELNKGK